MDADAYQEPGDYRSQESMSDHLAPVAATGLVPGDQRIRNLAAAAHQQAEMALRDWWRAGIRTGQLFAEKVADPSAVAELSGVSPRTAEALAALWQALSQDEREATNPPPERLVDLLAILRPTQARRRVKSEEKRQ